MITLLRTSIFSSWFWLVTRDLIFWYEKVIFSVQLSERSILCICFLRTWQDKYIVFWSIISGDKFLHKFTIIPLNNIFFSILNCCVLSERECMYLYSEKEKLLQIYGSKWSVMTGPLPPVRAEDSCLSYTNPAYFSWKQGWLFCWQMESFWPWNSINFPLDISSLRKVYDLPVIN